MDVDKEAHKLSWPAYAGLLKQLDLNRGIGLPKLKKYYFSKKPATFDFDLAENEEGLYPALRLLLCNNIQDDLVEELRAFNKRIGEDRNKLSTREDIIDLIFKVSNDHKYTFGDNTFYCGTEEKLLDALEYDSDSTLERIKHQSTEYLGGVLNRRIPAALDPRAKKYCWNAKPAKYDVSWREINVWKARIQGIPETNSVTKKIFTERLGALLLAEWICRNQSAYGSRSIHVAKTIKSILSDPSVAGNIRELGEEYIHDNFDKFVYDNRLGEEKVIVVRYENSTQVDAMLDTLDPSTRYPNQANDHNNMVRFIPWGREGLVSSSKAIVNNSWISGLSMSDFERLENNTVIFYPDRIKEARFSQLWYLSLDASSIKEKYEAKRQLPGDVAASTNSGFPYAMVSGSDIQTWCIHDGQYSLHVASRPKLKEAAQSCKSTKEFALSLLNEETAKLVKKEYANAVARAERRGEELERIITK